MSDKKISKQFTALTKDELLDVIEAYDLYVWTAFDANLPHTGWAPSAPTTRATHTSRHGSSLTWRDAKRIFST